MSHTALALVNLESLLKCDLYNELVLELTLLDGVIWLARPFLVVCGMLLTTLLCLSADLMVILLKLESE
jgi:hypothetical protein